MNLWKFYKDNPTLLEAKIGDDLAAIAAIVIGSSTKNALNVYVDGGSALPLPAGAATEATLLGIKTDIDKNYGTWSYYSGINGSVSVTGKVVGISAYSALGGSFTINGGATITLPIGVAISIEPKGNLVSPTIIFTGTSTYFIEVVS